MLIQDIQKLIRKNRFRSQGDLQKALREKGYELNQSSISRALKQLGAIKLKDETGGLYYQLPDDEAETTELPLRNVIIGIFSNHSLIVIKTQPGLAQVAALEVERHFKREILGTIAGDDTVFIAPQNERSIPSLKRNLQRLSR